MDEDSELGKTANKEWDEEKNIHVFKGEQKASGLGPDLDYWSHYNNHAL